MEGRRSGAQPRRRLKRRLIVLYSSFRGVLSPVCGQDQFQGGQGTLVEGPYERYSAMNWSLYI